MAANDDSNRIPPSARGAAATDMRLRDYFAGQALIGLLARNESNPPDSEYETGHYAVRSYRFADAMLRVRKETR